MLQGKTHAQIAAALSNPTSAIAEGVDGAANLITAAICRPRLPRPPRSAARPGSGRLLPTSAVPADLAAGTLGRPASRTAIALAAIGLAISVYLSIEHYDSASLLACPENATINCTKVTTSRWSHLAGIPVAVLGMAFFVVMLVLVSPRAWREPRLDAIRIGATAIGTSMVLYLVWIELFRVDAICLWCTAVHVCTIALLTAVLWHTSALRADVRTSTV